VLPSLAQGGATAIETDGVSVLPGTSTAHPELSSSSPGKVGNGARAGGPSDGGWLEDDTLVVVEDVMEGEDEEEADDDDDDDDDVATARASTPSATARVATPPPVATSTTTIASSVGPRHPRSPRMPPFFPIYQSAGKSKFRRWEEDLCAGNSDDELASATRCSYLEAARKALRTTPPPPVGAPDAALSAALWRVISWWLPRGSSGIGAGPAGRWPWNTTAAGHASAHEASPWSTASGTGLGAPAPQPTT
jgi:hypothetical protein